MSDDNIYQYSKITSQGTIRLMQLQPSPDLQAPVHCSIVHETLAKYENSLLEFYIAVSYVWGDLNIKSTISVDGERLEITSSLDTALRHIRDGERMLQVWADGVCIDQSDIEDRNLQVSLKGINMHLSRQAEHQTYRSAKWDRYTQLLSTLSFFLASHHLCATICGNQ
jgi:hypothetical protein